MDGSQPLWQVLVTGKAVVAHDHALRLFLFRRRDHVQRRPAKFPFAPSVRRKGSTTVQHAGLYAG